MASDIIIKIEPMAETENTENKQEISSEIELRHPEFITVKTELEVDRSVPEYPPPQPSSISWHVPVVPSTYDATSYPPNEPCENDQKDNFPAAYVKVEITPDDVQEKSNNAGHSKQSDKKCPMCPKEFKNKTRRDRHIQTHNKEVLKCDFCSKEYINESRFKCHLKTHIDKMFGCSFCDKSFATKKNLQQHEKVHHVDQHLTCEKCKKKFVYKCNLNNHMKRSKCSDGVGDPMHCYVCNKVFYKSYLLKSHLVKHQDIRPFICDHCGKSFKHKSVITRHMLYHSDTKRITCKLCPKTFVTRGLLKPHMKVHTGEKPFQCHICQKLFAHKHNMERHVIRHGKVKKLKCDVCDKTFPRESRLIYHMRTHAGLKTFACTLCPKTFSHKLNITRHYEKKHPGSQYEGDETDAKAAKRFWDEMQNHLLAQDCEDLKDLIDNSLPQ